MKTQSIAVMFALRFLEKNPRNVSCDEQKIGFLGQDQVDCICGKGLLTAFIFTM
jgi:hypothetical protein